MLYSLFSSLVDNYSFLNIFKYLTVRTGLAMFTSLFIVFIIGNPFIKYFSIKKIHDPIRNDGPAEHIVKKIGTPTMGGLLILTGLFSGVFLWGDLSNPYMLLLIFVVGSFGFLGALDEMLVKVSKAYDKEVEQSIKQLVSLIEPMMILIMAVIIGFIVVSMLLAIFSANDINF